MEEEIKVEKKSGAEKILKIFSVIITIFLLVVLIVIKLNNPSFPLLWIFIIGGSIILIGLLIFFSFSLIKKFKNKNIEEVLNNSPKPISYGELQALAEEALTNRYFANHIKECLEVRNFTVGKKVKNTVFLYIALPLYAPQDKNRVYIFINSQYPLDKRSIRWDLTETQIIKEAQQIGIDPEDEPDIREVVEKSPLTGIERTTKEIIHKKEKEEEKKKEGDLE